MFISAKHLEREMGVPHTIGKFFVDRRIPDDNSFWKDRLLYISFGNGYVSIPVYYGILHRIGLPLETLLNETHILFMEQLMHVAILHEKNKIDGEEELRLVRGMLKGRVQNESMYEKLNRYMDQPALKTMGPFGLNYPSLNRADLFLYVLCDLPLTDEQWEKAIRYWYALHPVYLIMDDIRDYTNDLEDGEDNVVIDLGGGAAGFEKALEMLQEMGKIMEEINPSLANSLTNEEELKKYIPQNI